MTKGLIAIRDIRSHYYKYHSKRECLEDIEKELKVLELMKKYNVRPSDFHYHTTYKVYLCNMSFLDDKIMNEEEYELLKEVLL